jgi:hypothetical protein
MIKSLLALACLAATSAAAEVTVLPGSGEQSTAAGTFFASPIRAQVRSASGAPAAHAWVTISIFGNPFELSSPGGGAVDCLLDASWQCFGYTDAEGIVSLPAFMPFVARDYEVRFSARPEPPAGFTYGEAIATLHATPSPVPARLDVQNMWWAGPVENGWGMSVVKHGDRLFNAIFAYDADGSPTWFVQPEGTWLVGPGGVTFRGALYSPRGAPWFDYDTARFRPGNAVGLAGVGFLLDTGEGYVDASIARDNGVAQVSKRVRVQDFTGDRPSPLQGVGDMWWGGPQQNGWGVAILEQFGGLFAVWFTYDADGKPTWFVMPGGEWRDASTYAGTMYRTSGSPWVGQAYDASRLRAGAVGPYVLKFLDTNNATLEISVDGVARTLPLTRQPF